MAKVEINVAGCDDNTIFEVYVSAAELHFLNMIAAKSVETSTYGCMPIIRITPLEQSKDVQAMTDLSTRAEQETILKFTRTEDKLRFFIAGLATLRLGAPNGVNPAIHHAKMLRTIRQSAKTLLQETSGEG